MEGLHTTLLMRSYSGNEAWSLWPRNHQTLLSLQMGRWNHPLLFYPKLAHTLVLTNIRWSSMQHDSKVLKSWQKMTCKDQPRHWLRANYATIRIQWQGTHPSDTAGGGHWLFHQAYDADPHWAGVSRMKGIYRLVHPRGGAQPCHWRTRRYESSIGRVHRCAWWAALRITTSKDCGSTYWAWTWAPPTAPCDLSTLRNWARQTAQPDQWSPAKGIHRPSISHYGAPILFVKKKSGELRMCIDYLSYAQHNHHQEIPYHGLMRFWIDWMVPSISPR